ncbi:MAG: hypothetical protein WC526_02565 [Patescibacteria group bacterium]
MTAIERKQASFKQKKLLAHIARFLILVIWTVVVAFSAFYKWHENAVIFTATSFAFIVVLLIEEWRRRQDVKYLNWWESEYTQLAQDYANAIKAATSSAQAELQYRRAVQYLETFRPPWGRT